MSRKSDEHGKSKEGGESGNEVQCSCCDFSNPFFNLWFAGSLRWPATVRGVVHEQSEKIKSDLLQRCKPNFFAAILLLENIRKGEHVWACFIWLNF